MKSSILYSYRLSTSSTLILDTELEFVSFKVVNHLAVTFGREPVPTQLGSQIVLENQIPEFLPIKDSKFDPQALKMLF